MGDGSSKNRMPPEFQACVDDFWHLAPDAFRREVDQWGLVGAAVRNIDRDDFDRTRRPWDRPSNLLDTFYPQRTRWTWFLFAGLWDADPGVVTLAVKWLPD